jgi:hypothetical protein
VLCIQDVVSVNMLFVWLLKEKGTRALEYIDRYICKFAVPSGLTVYGHSTAEIVGSKPTGSLRRADHSSRGVLQTLVRRCV